MRHHNSILTFKMPPKILLSATREKKSLIFCSIVDHDNFFFSFSFFCFLHFGSKRLWPSLIEFLWIEYKNNFYRPQRNNCKTKIRKLKMKYHSEKSCVNFNAPDFWLIRHHFLISLCTHFTKRNSNHTSNCWILIGFLQTKNIIYKIWKCENKIDPKIGVPNVFVQHLGKENKNTHKIEFQWNVHKCFDLIGCKGNISRLPLVILY